MSQATLGYALCVVYSISFDKCTVTGMYYYSILQSSFTALKLPCVSPIHLSFPIPEALATAGIYIVSVILLIQNDISWNQFSMYPFHIGFIHLCI